MREKSRLVVGIDQTWAVADRATEGAREVKYTVDAVGTELLLYRDSVAAHVLTRDRAAVLAGRLTRALPDPARRALARLRRAVPTLRLAARERRHRWISRHPGLARAGLVPVGGAVRGYRAALVTGHDSLGEERHQRDRVLAVLRAAGVEAAVLPAAAGERAVVVVRDAERSRAIGALARALDPPWYVVPLDTPRARPARLTVRRLQRLCAASDGFRVFRYVAAGPGRVLSGARLGADVEVWRAPRPALLDRPSATWVRAGALVAPRRNPWASHLAPDTWQGAGARPGHLVDVGPLPHLFDVTAPIDVVYTWVDGADPAWRAAKQAARAARGLPPGADDAARFRSHDELRFSLRSLERYAPWVRRVHVVTAGQRPAWLEPDHPRLRLVDHREIFADPDVLPVFNSHAIESQLHRVPGLTEHYVYFNDDVFLGRPVGTDLFFQGNGRARFFPSSAVIGLGPRGAHDPLFTQAAKNNRDLVERVFGRTVTHHFQHAPHPQLRSVLEAMEAAHPEEFRAVAASAFRDAADLSIASSLHHHYAYGLGRAVPGRLAYLYLDLHHPGAARRLERLLRVREFDVFCLNDTPAPPRAAERQARLLRGFLERYYPTPSSFER